MHSSQTLHQNPEYQQQNELLDQLHESVMNTRHYAINIGSEIGEQDAMLDQLHTNVGRTTDESRRQNQNVVQLLKESKNRGFYTAVIVLVVIILFLLLV